MSIGGSDDRPLDRWKTRGREVVFRPDGGRWLSVERHVVELPDGRRIDEWLWLDMPDYVNVLVETVDEQYVCFRQVKYAVEGETLAVVGGYLEPGEPPLDAARREVREETGYEASEWIDLGSYVVDGNRGAGTAHLFHARQAVEVGPPDADDLEEQVRVLLSRPELEDALTRGAFGSVSWATTVALALR